METNRPDPLKVPCAVLVLSAEIVAVADITKMYISVTVEDDGLKPGTYEIVTDFVPVIGGNT